MKLQLLFLQNGLIYREVRGRATVKTHTLLPVPGEPLPAVEAALAEALSLPYIKECEVVSALNHFGMMPEDFKNHELGFDIIGLNAMIQPEDEELMLAVSRKFRLQFYYCLPQKFYQPIKDRNLPTTFTFSGEKFLAKIAPRATQEIHIHLYANQCEFFALKDRKVILYNNLDASSEVDFLYFIMFTLSKIGFSVTASHFHLYGEISANDTFVSELRKFVKNLKIHFENTAKKHFILD